MGQKGAEIWANLPDLQPVHGKSDTLLESPNALAICDMEYVFMSHTN